VSARKEGRRGRRRISSVLPFDEEEELARASLSSFVSPSFISLFFSFSANERPFGVKISK